MAARRTASLTRRLLLTAACMRAAEATRVLARRPTADDVAHVLTTNADARHNYELVGMTRSGKPRLDARGQGRVRVIHKEVELGTRGQRGLSEASAALLAFRMHDGSRTNGIALSHACAHPGDVIATYARSGLGAWCVNACRVLYTDRARHSLAVAYGTLRGHWLAGEERMVVELEPHTGRVTFSLLSVSRGSGPLGALVFPFIRGMQERFFTEQVHTMQRLCS